MNSASASSHVFFPPFSTHGYIPSLVRHTVPNSARDKGKDTERIIRRQEFHCGQTFFLARQDTRNRETLSLVIDVGRDGGSSTQE